MSHDHPLSPALLPPRKIVVVFPGCVSPRRPFPPPPPLVARNNSLVFHVDIFVHCFDRVGYFGKKSVSGGLFDIWTRIGGREMGEGIVRGEKKSGGERVDEL